MVLVFQHRATLTRFSTPTTDGIPGEPGGIRSYEDIHLQH